MTTAVAAASYAAFEAEARADGFDEVLVREWAPGQVLLAWTDVSAADASTVRMARVEVGS